MELCQLHEIPFTEIKLRFGENLTYTHLEQFENKNYTGFLIQLCETSTGILYDMNLIGDFCEKNGLFLFVDAVSGFMADKFYSWSSSNGRRNKKDCTGTDSIFQNT